MQNTTRPIRTLDSLTMDFISERCQITPTGCWEWQLCKLPNGYGLTWVDNKKMSAHRVAAIIAHGKPEPGMFALHSCDNPSCCNPDHLRWGNNSDNMLDASKRGRIVDNRGFKSGLAKLTPKDLAVIFEMRAKGSTYQKIGDTIGVHRACVSQAYRGITYKNETAEYRLEGQQNG